MATANLRNGVDVGRLNALVQQLRADPAQAVTKFEARCRWEGGLRTRTEVSYFWMGGDRDDSRARPHVIEADEPTSLLGSDAAADAVELLLAALGASLAASWAVQAAARGVTLRALELAIQGDLDLRMFLGLSDRVHSGVQLVRIKAKVDADASDEVLAEIKAAAERGSPVWNTLTRPVRIISTVSRE
ncbi:MAG TPA: OsmC family protein [Chloroflexota bacterium]|nr:OsmC family protein [Chloroflexota bacterium]